MLKTSSPPAIIYDRGRLSTTQSISFNKYILDTDSFLARFGLKQYAGNVLNIKDSDSLKTPGIWAGDFVAGSYHRKFKYDDSEYYDLLKHKLIGKGSLKLWF